MTMRQALAPLVILLALAAAGCGADGAREAGPVPTAGATETAPSSPVTVTDPAPSASTEPTDLGPKTCSPQTGGDEGVYTNLVAVRVGAHDGFDRIVFEFAPPSPNPGGKAGIPHFDLRTAKPPFSEDPSDLPIDVEGDAFVRIVFQGASGYDFDGNATYDGPRRFTPGFGTLAQVVEAGDFEATMTWILGLSRTTCGQVAQLHNPDRLVIDFHHV